MSQRAGWGGLGPWGALQAATQADKQRQGEKDWAYEFAKVPQHRTIAFLKRVGKRWGVWLWSSEQFQR